MVKIVASFLQGRLFRRGKTRAEKIRAVSNRKEIFNAEKNCPGLILHGKMKWNKHSIENFENEKN